MSTAAKSVDERRYRKLVAETLPRVIHDEEENQRCIATLEALHDRGHLTPEEERLAELLTLLIENFEARHYQLAAASPVEIVRELMAVNNLKQADLIEIFGSASVVSEVLNGKRDFAKAPIEKLSRADALTYRSFFSRGT
jgi:HTH-type transcriptional regulator/antitoxin HigA